MNLNLSVIRRILMVFFNYCYIIYAKHENGILHPEAVFQKNKNYDPNKIPLATISAFLKISFPF